MNTTQDRDKVFLGESHEEFGYIAYNYNLNGPNGGCPYMGDRMVSGEVSIADCHNKITLDFGCNNVKTLKKRINKLEVLINTLQKMLDGYRNICKIQTRRSKVY
jgi:hypothetical protein